MARNRSNPLEDSGGRGHTDIEIVKMTRAQQNTRDFRKMWTRPYLAKKELKWMITQTFSGTADLTAYLDEVDSYYEGKVKAPSGEPYTDPYEDPSFIKRLENRLLKEWVESSREFDATSRVAMKDYGVSGWKFPYKMFSHDVWTAWMVGGKLCIITGDKGSGKSDHAEELGSFAIANHSLVLSNIQLVANKEVPGYVYCRTFSQMIELICDAKTKDVHVLLILDEAGLEFASYDSPTTEGKEHDRFAKLTRKFGVDEIFIIQYEHQVPFTLKKHFDVWIQKQEKHLMRYFVRAGEYEGFDETIMNVSRTEIPFDTDHIAGMKVDIEVRALLDFLETLPPHADQFAELRNYLRMHRGDAKAGDIPLPDKKWIALRLWQYNQQCEPEDRVPLKVLSNIFNIGRRTFKRWVRDAVASYGGDLDAEQQRAKEAEADDEWGPQEFGPGDEN